jgi:hypothetical protein
MLRLAIVALAALLAAPFAGRAAAASNDDASAVAWPAWVWACTAQLEAARAQLAARDPLFKSTRVDHSAHTVHTLDGPTQGFVVTLRAGEPTRRFFEITISTRHDLVGRALGPPGWQEGSWEWRPTSAPPLTLLLRRFVKEGYNAWIQVNAPAAQGTRFARAVQPAADTCLEAAIAEPLN